MVYLIFLLSSNMITFIYSAILRTGNPLLWQQSKPYLNQVRLSGIEQFINHYQRSKHIKNSIFLWGDEIEYGVFELNKDKDIYDLSLKAGTRLRDELSLKEQSNPHIIGKTIASNLDQLGCEWQPEYGAWMIEAVPNKPYSNNILGEYYHI